LIIFTEFDSSTTNAPAGFFTAVNAAVEYWERAIVDPIQVTIEFGWGKVGGQALGSGALGESETSGLNFTYAQVRQALTSHATSPDQVTAAHSLPATAPTSASYFVALGEAMVLGLTPSANQLDGAVGMSSTSPFTFDPYHRAVAGDYDAIGTMEHEISEVLGRIAGSGVLQNGTPQYSPADLFRYTGPGKLALTPEAASFSINGGQTLLLPFNNPSYSDAADWATSVQGDAFGEGFAGLQAVVSPTDREFMNVLGFDLAPDPTARNDFNADGKSDFLIRNTAGLVEVGEDHNNSATLSQVTTLSPSTWTFIADGDFLGSGSDQFLVENATGVVDDGQEVAGGKETLQKIASLPGWKIVGVGDFLGLADGDQFLMQNSAGLVDVGNAISGSAVYTHVTTLAPSVWKFIGAGNFLGTGPSEFLVQESSGNFSMGEVENGKVVFTDLGVLALSWKFVGDGDFLNDGRDQFLIENTDSAVAIGEVANGKLHYTYVMSLPAQWKFVGTGDYVGEGHDSFLIENTAGQVEVGDFTGGHIHLTQIATLGPEWTFH
jgi:hypothetical protein